MSQVAQHLKALCRAIHTKSTKSEYRKLLGKYCCQQSFVLKNGQQFKSVIPLPRDIKKGKLGCCYENAFKNVLMSKGKYFYCEGYATAGGMVHEHGWMTNRNHEVIDPTWLDGKDYYGIIFKFSCVMHWMAKNGKYISIIGNYHDDWPLLKMSRKELIKNIEGRVMSDRTT